jgi:hypothetical protein
LSLEITEREMMKAKPATAEKAKNDAQWLKGIERGKM